MLKWARENGCPWDEMTCAAAAQEEYLDVLKWACAIAAGQGHHEVVKLATSNGCDYDEETHATAAHYSQLEPLLYLESIGCRAGTGSCAAAAINGHLHFMC